MAEQEASRWGYEPESSGQATIPGQNLPMIGTDEVGNGSYFGGLAVVAGFVRPEDHSFLKSLGVDDSKNDRPKICQIAPLLKENPHQALLLSPKNTTKSSSKATMRCLSRSPYTIRLFSYSCKGCPA